MPSVISIVPPINSLESILPVSKHNLNQISLLSLATTHSNQNSNSLDAAADEDQ